MIIYPTSGLFFLRSIIMNTKQVLEDEYCYLYDEYANNHDSPDEFISGMKIEGRIRNNFLSKYGFVILTKSTLKILVAICKDKKVIDIASGAGWISHKLKENNIDITSIDNSSWNDKFFKKIWHLTIQGDVLTYDTSEYDNIILSWPIHNDDFGVKVLQKISNTQTLIYQGESKGGCTGNDEFHQILKNEFIEDEELSDALNEGHVNFSGIYDNWHVYCRKL